MPFGGPGYWGHETAVASFSAMPVACGIAGVSFLRAHAALPYIVLSLSPHHVVANGRMRGPSRSRAPAWDQDGKYNRQAGRLSHRLSVSALAVCPACILWWDRHLACHSFEEPVSPGPLYWPRAAYDTRSIVVDTRTRAIGTRPVSFLATEIQP